MKSPFWIFKIRTVVLLTTLFVITIGTLSTVTYAFTTIMFTGRDIHTVKITTSVLYSMDDGVTWVDTLDTTANSVLYAELENLEITGFVGSISIIWSLYMGTDASPIYVFTQGSTAYSYLDVSTKTIKAIQVSMTPFNFGDWMIESEQAYHIVAEVSQV